MLFRSRLSISITPSQYTIHEAAPPGGSVVLAALMLKMGIYGFIRFNLPVTPDASHLLAWPMIILGLIAVVYVAYLAITQTDLKRLVAYSSIAHMGFAIVGCFMIYVMGASIQNLGNALLSLEGAIVQMIAHAFGSGAMFIGAGVLFDQLHTRLLKNYGGVAVKMPVFAAFFMLFAMSNVGLPGTSGFVGEFMIILAAFHAHFWVAFFAASTLIFGAAYTLWMVEQVDMIFCTYWYANKFNGNGQVEQILINHERERFIKPGKYKWVSRLHEVCVPNEPNPKIVQYSYDPTVNQNIVWVHTADLGKAHLALQRNVRILEIQAEEENYKDPRTVFYLAKTYFDINTPEKLKLADKLLDDYIAVSGWDAEKANAYEYKGLIAHKNMQLDEAKKHYLNAIATYPRHHNPYLRLADVLFHKNEVELAVFYLDVVEKVLGEYKSQATIGNPFEIKLLYLTLRYMVAFRSGNLAEAKKWALERHKIQPDGLLNDVIYYENKELVARAFVNLATFYNKTNNYKALYLLLDNAPIEFREEGFLMQLSQLLPGKKWQDNEICYYASFGQKHFELWNGDSLAKGIGGSESAVIYLSEEWARPSIDN